MSENTTGISASAVTASISAMLISIFFFFDGMREIHQHRVLGWLVCGACVLTFGVHFYRLAKFEISAWKKNKV